MLGIELRNNFYRAWSAAADSQSLEKACDSQVLPREYRAHPPYDFWTALQVKRVAPIYGFAQPVEELDAIRACLNLLLRVFAARDVCSAVQIL